MSYLNALDLLKKMKEEQLIEFFNDIGDLSIVERIYYCAFEALDKYEEPEEEKSGKSEYEEAREIDNARRYREYANEKKGIW